MYSDLFDIRESDIYFAVPNVGDLTQAPFAVPNVGDLTNAP